MAALSFSFRHPYHFDSGTRIFLATLAEQCALALERVRLTRLGSSPPSGRPPSLRPCRTGSLPRPRAALTYVNERAKVMRQEGRRTGRAQGLRRLSRHRRQAGPSRDGARARDGSSGGSRGIRPGLGAWVDARLYPAPEGLSIVSQDISARRRRQGATTFLADASRQLAESLDYQRTIRAVAEGAVPTLGDWCVVTLIEDPESHEWPPRLDRSRSLHTIPRCSSSRSRSPTAIRSICRRRRRCARCCVQGSHPLCRRSPTKCSGCSRRMPSTSRCCAR